jgi:histidyl-tRNA synthetase
MIRSLKGTQDILPQDIGRWNEIESASRRIFSIHGYQELRTPIIEESALFAHSVGEDTDIVKKQMYAFKDQGGRDITLRPEETAAVVRAYLENNLDKEYGFIKLFYIGPMFRSERPQAGRLRQFHQIGVEAIGSSSPYMDAEVIILLDELLKAYKISKYILNINSLGCEKDRDSIKEVLKKELKHHLNSLCEDCKRRYKTNILRILDCKGPACKKIIASVSLAGFLCKDCKADFVKLQKILDDIGIKYQISQLLVRGLDYYTGVVFEVNCDELGAQNAIAAGGRYDNLISDFGGQKTGACGFAIGIERVIDIISKAEPKDEAPKKR